MAASALFVLLLASPAVLPVGLALPIVLDAIALVNWAVDPECSLWLSRVRTALLFVAMLGPTATWACLRGAFGPPDAWAYWDPGAALPTRWRVCRRLRCWSSSPTSRTAWPAVPRTSCDRRQRQLGAHVVD